MNHFILNRDHENHKDGELSQPAGPGRTSCASCRLPGRYCVCSFAPKLDLKTQLCLVLHLKEWPKTSNTGQLYHMIDSRTELLLHGRQHHPLEDLHLTGDTSRSTLVLYPGRGARPLTQELIQSLPAPPRLLVPDGTWGQACRMMKRLPAMASLPKVEVPVLTPDRNRPRRNLRPERVSTFEAIAEALGILEGPEVKETLLDFFQRFADRLLFLRGKLKAHEVFGGLPEAPAKINHLAY